MITKSLCLGLGLLVLQVSIAQSELPRNGGFEEPSSSGAFPSCWSPVSIGVPARMAADAAVKHEGKVSLRIDAQEVTRSYVVSEAMPVAPGEKIAASMWVRHTNVPAGKGTVIAIAEFLNSQKTQLSVAKISTADLGNPNWQSLAGSVTVPESTAFLKLRLGFSYSQGTCWWDDVRLKFQSRISARFDLPDGRLTPANESIAIILLNRAGLKGPAEIRLKAAQFNTNASAQLSGEPVQIVHVPLSIQKAGKIVLKGSIWTNGAEAAVFESPATVPQRLALDPVIPTHWAKEDGKPTIKGRIQIAIGKAELSRARLEARLLDGSGKGICATTLPSVRDGINDFELAAPELPEGEYTLETTLARAGAPEKAAQKWKVISRSKCSVAVSDNGYPVYDGRTFFPLGVFNCGARMKEMSSAGFTVSHAYNTVEARLFGNPDDNKAKTFLDESERAGMKALMLIPRYALFHGDWETVRRRVLMFRNHPGLLAWDEEEGIARGDMKPETLRELSKIIRELDPHHPLMVGDSCDVIGRVPADRSNFFLADTMDFGMWWWYPFPVSSTANALEGDEAGNTANMPLPAFLINAATKKPLWVGIQAYKKPPATARYPLPAEYRWQAYAAICAGAKGLMWYGGSVTGGTFLNPEEANWEYIKSLAKEVHDLSPVLTGAILKPPAISPGNAPVTAAIRQGGGRTLLFVVNRSMQAAEATVSLPEWKSAHLWPEAKELVLQDHAIKTTFEPLGVRIFELRK